MKVLLAFDKLDFRFGLPLSNQRKIYATIAADKRLKKLGIDVDRLVAELASAMTSNNYHRCEISKNRSGFSVDFHKFSDHTIEWLKKNYGGKKQ
jgi:hypothetical protein